mgnify:CR=1 FL=1
MIKIRPKMFSGTSKVFDGTLEAVLRGIVQTQAQVMVSGRVDALTDDSGGTPGVGLVAPIVATPFTAGTTDAVAKAEVEASLTSVRRNLRRLIEKTNEFVAVAPFFPALTESLGGSAPTAALEATDISMTGTSSGGTLAEAQAFNAAVAALTARTSQLRHWVNILAVAVGVDPLSSTLPTVPISNSFAAVTVTVGSTTEAGAVAKAEADPILVTLAANVSTIGAKLNEIADLTPSLGVVAA